MRKTIGFKFISILVIGILLLTACSSNSTSSSISDDKSGGENPVKDRGNEIVIGVGTEPQNWDPIDTFRLDWSTVMTSVYEGLVKRTVDLEIQPGLATEWEYLDDNTLQFKLREGVVFHDGEPFNADAVKFTFDRLLGEEGGKGPQQANYTSIDHVEVVDDYTVNFIMKTKDPVIITKLAGYGAVIVPPKYIEEKGDEFFNNNPVGTGPFKLTAYESNNKVVLEKNPDYWQAELPKLDKVTFRIIPESATRLAELQTGKIDIMKKVEVSQADTVKNSSFLDLMEVGTPTANAIRFDLNEKPTDDIRVRQAINYAIDKQALIDEILSGYGKPIASFQSELSFGNNPDLEPYPYDPEKAKELLQEAGVAEGTELDFYISGTDATFKEIAQAVAFFLEQVGLKANINSVDSNTLGTELIPQGNAGHMWQQGWGGWTLDFDNTAYLMYHEGEYYNPTFKDDKVEELLTAERTTVDQEERENIFMELTERIYELTPEVPLYSTVDLYAVNKRVKNFQPPHDDRMFLENVTVE